MRYWVRIYRHGKDYSALVPDLPGCVAAGNSVEDVRSLIAKAISLHLEMMQRSKETMSTPTQRLDLDLGELEDGEICTWVDVDMPLSTARRKQRARAG